MSDRNLRSRGGVGEQSQEVSSSTPRRPGERDRGQEDLTDEEDEMQTTIEFLALLDGQRQRTQQEEVRRERLSAREMVRMGGNHTPGPGEGQEEAEAEQGAVGGARADAGVPTGGDGGDHHLEGDPGVLRPQQPPQLPGGMEEVAPEQQGAQGGARPRDVPRTDGERVRMRLEELQGFAQLGLGPQRPPEISRIRTAGNLPWKDPMEEKRRLLQLIAQHDEAVRRQMREEQVRTPVRPRPVTEAEIKEKWTNGFKNVD